jgi:RNA polymerase-binding transcription factor DksA
MNDAQLTHFRKILEAWRNQLRDEVDRTVSHMQDEPLTSRTRLTVPRRKRNSVWSCVTAIANVN